MFMLALIIMERGKWIKMTKDLNKKGEGNIGGGITWFIATLIIFIIMAFFVLACLTAGSINKITQGKHDISIVLEQGNLIETEILYGFLNTPVKTTDGIKKISEMMIEYHKSKKYKKELLEQAYILNFLTYKERGCNGFCLFSYEVRLCKEYSCKLWISSETYESGFLILSSGYVNKTFGEFVLLPEENLKAELVKAREDFEHVKKRLHL